MIVRVVLHNEIRLEFRDAIVIRGLSTGSVTTVWNQLGQGVKHVIVIVLFRK